MFKPHDRSRRRDGSRRHSGRLAVLLAVVAVIALASLPAAPAGAINQTAPFLGGYGSTCFWHYGPFGGPESEEPTYNLAYPNGHAIYFGAYFRRPAGSKLVLRGQYPHSRNFNFVTYTPNSVILDGIYDEQINPDEGSINPFRAGENRNATNRNFSVEVLASVNPTASSPRTATHFSFEAPRNYIYAASSPAIEEESPAHKKFVNELIMERIYLPDRGQGIDGGVPVPEPELTLANGEKFSGQAACNQMDTESKTLVEEGGQVRFGTPPVFTSQETWHYMNHPEETPSPGCNVYALQGTLNCPLWNGKPVKEGAKNELIQVPRTVEYPEEFPATPFENWRVQYNRRYLLQLWTGEGAPGAEPSPTRGNDGGGFFPNPDNNYVRQVFNRKFGKLVVLKGKLPTTPETSFNHAAVMPDMHNYQLRFYDTCSISGMTVSQVLSCRDDEETAVDASRNYTMVYSRPEDKPRNAVRFCGNTWLEWNPEGDANPGPEQNTDFGYITIRMLLPNPTFTNAIQYTTKPGTEREVMGEYLPTWNYEAEKASFESTGCSAANPGTPQLAAGSSSPSKGAFTLEWSPSREAAKVSGVTYTLQHKPANGSWETVASGLTSPSYAFSSEAQGTWTYRVSASGEGAESEDSAESSAVTVDTTAPPSPTALVSRAPDFAGAGGWYKDSVMVSFASNGTATLPDGSEGAALDPSTLTGIQTVEGSGSHEVCGTVADVLGNVSAPGCVTVQVDATAPSVSVSCPATAQLDASGVSATVAASDGQSGLAVDPSGSVSIATGSLGAQTVSETAVDNVGNETSKSCTTDVVYAFSALKPASGKKIKAGNSTVVQFRLRDALGYVTDGSATLEIAPVTGGVVGSYKPAGAHDAFTAGARGKYTYSLSTSGLAKGTWSLRVNLSDGTTHTTTITIH